MEFSLWLLRSLDPAGTGVEAVLDQLLDHRGRQLDDLAGSDLVDEFGGKQADERHPPTLAANAGDAVDDDQLAGMVSVAPARTVLLLIRLAFFSAPTLTPYRRARSEEHTSELQSLMRISYAVFCLKKKKPTRHAHKS